MPYASRNHNARVTINARNYEPRNLGSISFYTTLKALKGLELIAEGEALGSEIEVFSTLKGSDLTSNATLSGSKIE